MALTRIHHINFIVRDLNEAMARYERILGVDPFVVVDHPTRNAKIARARVGESWLVLVSPNDAESAPGRYLEKNGEGFFLLSLGVDNLEQRLEQLESDGIDTVDAGSREGILDWRVADIGALHGAVMQLTDDSLADTEK
jgi:methylmalonyl-CoA/ethylmalonyl-CoA epimerase